MRGPKGIALDLKEQKIYWIESLGKIQRANLNGSHIENLTTQLTDVNDLALDLTTGKIYWTAWDPNTNTGKIQHANLNGSRVKDVVTGLGYPLEIALYSPGAYTVTADADKLITIWAKIK